MILIRNFKEDELETICEFKRQSSMISFPDKEINIEIFKNNLIKQSKKDPASVKVLEKDGDVIGYTWFKIKHTLTGRCGVICHTAIDEKHRGFGFGKKLMYEAEKYFKEKNISRIKVTVTNSNENSLNFCKSLGYKEKRTILEKEI